MIGETTKCTAKVFLHGKTVDVIKENTSMTSKSISFVVTTSISFNLFHRRKHGLGEFYWPDKRVYKGYWEDGKQHGRGLYKGPNGSEREGEWKEGKNIRW